MFGNELGDLGSWDPNVRRREIARCTVIALKAGSAYWEAGHRYYR